MKTHISLLISACCILLLCLPFPASAANQESSYSVVERGLHHRVLERVDHELAPDGQPAPKVHRYTELSSGLHHVRNGVYVESSNAFEAFPGGAIARHGQHSLILANDLATPGAVHLQMPDGTELRSHLLGLSYLDPETGEHVLFAEVKASQGVIDANTPGQVIYPDAFTGLRGSVRYTYRTHGMEQDILLAEAPPPPEAFGINPASAKLCVVTEFLAPPAPSIVPVPVAQNRSAALPDCTLDFGTMSIGPGKALFLGTSPEAKAVSVSKEWLEIDGRWLLLEQVPVTVFQEELRSLPKSGSAALQPARKFHRFDANKPSLPPLRSAKTSSQPMTIARVSLPSKALLLDYAINLSSGTFTNYTFLAGSTYYVSGPITLRGVTTIEAGTVIKLPVSSTATIVATNVVCKTRPYCQAIFTASTDSSYGETVTSGSISGYYGNIALDLSGASVAPQLSNIRFCYLSNALAGTSITLQNAQFINCKTILASGSSQPAFNNALIYRANTVLANSSADTFTAAHLTAHFCTNLLANTSGTIRLTNCLFACVTNWQCSATETNASVFLNSDAGVFQTVGAAGHYLAPDSPYRNAGTTNVNAAVLAAIRTKTTYPPIVFSNVTISADTTFSPQAQRDTDIPDLGFGYDPLDVVFGGVTANANLTFTPGTVAGWFRVSSGWYHAGHGIHLGDNTSANFDGRAEAPTWWVHCIAAQEGGTGLWQGGYGPGGMTGWTTSSFAAAPRVNLRFTKVSTGADFNNPFRDDYGYLSLTASHSEFYTPGLGGYIIGLNFTNCLFERLLLWTSWNNNSGDDATNCAVRFRNCTIIGGNFGLQRSSSTNPQKWAPWLIRDTIIDGSVLSSFSDGAAGAASVTDFNYNAFLTGAPRLVPNGANDVLVTGSFNWQTSWLGDYFLPSDSPAIDAGSATANLLGLYHFSSQTNGAKELSSQVDIGWHAVATDENGVPIDTDADGIPDSYEDANGNASVNSGETDWESALDAGLKVWITQPRRNSNLP